MTAMLASVDPAVAWSALAAGTVFAAVALAAALDWLFDRLDRGPNLLAAAAGPAIVLPELPAERHAPPLADVILAAREAARRVAEDWTTLAEFARPEPTAPALIGSDVEAWATLRMAGAAA